MPLYEHVFIARQDLSNTQAEGLIEHFSTVLADNGGKVVENEYWGVKTMAYKINKNRKGHYAFLKSDAPAAAVQEMERLMRLHDDVMRVLTIKVDKHAEGVSVQMQKRDEREAGAIVATVVAFGGERRERPSFGDRPRRSRWRPPVVRRSASLI
jgi:small subunit ribosomal protein S6